jgi:aspartate racemase
LKTIGLIGGMSWESSAEYYRLINEGVKAQLGGLHSAQCVLVSVDFAEIEALQHAERWAEAGEALAHAAHGLERAGADFIVLCTNTMHKVAPAIEAATRLPLLHIADATAERIQAAGLRRVGLLGTRFTMEQDFYTGRLIQCHGLDVLLPGPAERETIHRVIYDELCLGIISPASRDEYRRIMAGLVAAGAEGIILGCTEIELLIRAEDTTVPQFPTTRLHAEAAVALALTS